MNKIQITDLHIRPTVGVYDHERNGPQDVYLDIMMEFERPMVADELETTVDYDPIVAAVDEYAKNNKPFLIETIGEAVLDLCFENKLVTSATVSVKKPGALQGRGVAVTVSRERA